jgi:hypothetical protein
MWMNYYGCHGLIRLCATHGAPLERGIETIRGYKHGAPLERDPYITGSDKHGAPLEQFIPTTVLFNRSPLGQFVRDGTWRRQT